MCLRGKESRETEKETITHTQVNLRDPAPKHLSAFYMNETERFGHLFIAEHHLN